jgi:hypothetical protein
MDWGVPVATGCRLYGHVTCTARGSVISALDPRESNAATEVYIGGLSYVIDTFRDALNGIALIPILGDNVHHCHVDIFDERACAMIGTPIMLNPYEYLFCPRDA